MVNGSIEMEVCQMPAFHIERTSPRKLFFIHSPQRFKKAPLYVEAKYFDLTP